MKAEQAFQQALAVSKRSTRETLIGGGALVGKNVTISKIEPIPGGNRVTFSYTLDDGQARTSTLDVMDGKDGAVGPPGKDGVDGNGILDISKIGSEGLVDTYRISFSDGTHYDHEVHNGRQGQQGIPGPQGKDGPQGRDGQQGIAGPKGNDGYPFLIYKEYADISAFDPDDFPEIGLMFMLRDGDGPTAPVYRYTGDPEAPYSYVTSLSGGESIKGEPGAPGRDGEQGPPGKNGRDGTTYTPKIGAVATVPHGTPASASVSVDEETSEATFNFSIPEGGQGPEGRQGRPGDTGKDGTTPHIGDNRHWFIGDTDTGVSANGLPGAQGEPGQDGEKGEPGRSMVAVRTDGDNNVIATFSDGTEADIGHLDINVSVDFLTSPGFGGLRYHAGKFQYYDKTSDTWIDAQATQDNPILVKIVPQAMQSISGTYDRKLGRNKLKWMEPNDTVIDGQAICVVEKVAIIRKLGSEPEDISDGIQVVQVPRRDFGRYADTWYVDGGFSPGYGDVWHYKAFPVSTTGFVNPSSLNDVPVSCRAATLYGFIIDQKESDPDSMITYIEDNEDLTPAHMDYENDRFDYGDWKDAWFIKGLKPCMLNYDGTVAYELDPDDYTKKKDGTPSDVANADFPGNAMVGIPKVYWKIVDNGDDTANIYICDTKLDGGFVCWSHIDNNGNEIDHCYMPSYYGSLVNDRLRSISGKQALVGTTDREQEIDYAKGNNLPDDIIWYTEVYSDRVLINLLLILIGRSTDTQNVFGAGNNDSSASTSDRGIKKSGTMDKKGLFWGSQDDISGVKVFGMEHWWGNAWRAVAGYVNAGGTQKVKMTYGQSDGSATDGYNLDGSGYIVIPDHALSIHVMGSYLKKVAFTEYGMIPMGVNGSSKTYFCDALWADADKISYVLYGGTTSNKDMVGAFITELENGTAAYWCYGACLSCKPLAPTGGGKT